MFLFINSLYRILKNAFKNVKKIRIQTIRSRNKFFDKIFLIKSINILYGYGFIWPCHLHTRYKKFIYINWDGFVKSPVLVIARSSANAGRRSNPVFSRTYKNEIASSASGGLAMTLLPTFYEAIINWASLKLHFFKTMPENHY
jgi:hypothetical protein